MMNPVGSRGRIREYLPHHHFKAHHTKMTEEKNPNWNGGRAKSGDYYIRLIRKNSPFWSMANKKGYVLEHRLVMAEYLRRPLESHESVHHINGDKRDNRLDNLQLRIGSHGVGARFMCGDCGSINVLAVDL